MLLGVPIAGSHPVSVLTFPVEVTGTGPKHTEPQSKEKMGWKSVGRNYIQMAEVESIIPL